MSCRRADRLCNCCVFGHDKSNTCIWAVDTDADSVDNGKVIRSTIFLYFCFIEHSNPRVNMSSVGCTVQNARRHMYYVAMLDGQVVESQCRRTATGHCIGTGCPSGIKHANSNYCRYVNELAECRVGSNGQWQRLDVAQLHCWPLRLLTRQIRRDYCTLGLVIVSS